MTACSRTTVADLVAVDFPCYDNAGCPISANWVEAFEHDLRMVTDGWSCRRTIGKWWNQVGRCFVDENLRYEFATSRNLWPDGVGTWLQLIPQKMGELRRTGSDTPLLIFHSRPCTELSSVISRFSGPHSGVVTAFDSQSLMKKPWTAQRK